MVDSRVESENENQEKKGLKMEAYDRLLLADVIANFSQALIVTYLNNAEDEKAVHGILTKFLDTMCGLMDASYEDGLAHGTSRAREPSLN